MCFKLGIGHTACSVTQTSKPRQEVCTQYRRSESGARLLFKEDFALHSMISCSSRSCHESGGNVKPEARKEHKPTGILVDLLPHGRACYIQ